MGICLDTDASAAQDTGEPGNDWNHTRNRNGPNAGPGSVMALNGNGRLGSGNIAAIDMQNAGKIKFDPPKVPVIFVLGGPGSGKVTHCDTFMQERRGVTHINMMDLLQQYAMGSDMQDFSQLSSKTVTEVLMLEMKMAPAAKAYLISGYPRSMRDVVEYSEKIQVVNGVILISWRQSVLQKQIDYGAKLGHVVLSLAKMELENFFKNVMPVADYFDQSDMLLAVNGERAPTEVYKDFRTAVLDILSTLENQEAILNGVTGMGRGIHDIPGSIVSVDTAPSQAQAPHITDQVVAPVPRERNVTNAVISHIAANTVTAAATLRTGGTSADDDSGVVVTQQPKLTHAGNSMDASDEPEPTIPPIIWVIGGPGSNKATLCLKAISLNPGWSHISVGRLLRNITDTAPRANTESYAVKEALAAGEMAPEKSLNQLLDNNIRQLQDKSGIIIDGYPRNLQQVKYFENKYKQRPPTILLDCSKLQLGRGRIDDTVSSFRRRLELFREQTLPMLKTMDSSNRLQIVDGDTDSPSVQREFERLIRNHIQQLTNKLEGEDASETLGNHVMRNEQTDAILHDLETNVPGAVPTISHHVSMMNGHLKSRGSALVSAKRPTQMMNGHVAGRPGTGPVAPLAQPVDFRHMLEEAERYPVDSYM
ncbi:adenylate kinase isoenzyme 5 isoform X1 [Drosophila novamexicana]|uniref:adenylate kinase isoenzyme 5 isoform X1 n=1 Tax=Drosophila novamexicana TaxID=47314 RepID=UPI0011E5B6D2|nr:adenylate kinase isoenzyme 5 isoform X1 [Drosophila novamexicana]XP_030561307.1 adenylate kinase isoenzyme 5 isoform X1 [Drosophila novamexicana]